MPTETNKDNGPQGTQIMSALDMPALIGESVNAEPLREATLTITNPGFEGQVFVLSAPRTSIGRDPRNDIVLNHASVSAEHAQIVNEQGRLRVINLLSSNGTFINGRKVSQHRLYSGDRLQFGEMRMLLSGVSKSNRHWLSKTIGLVAAVASATIVAALLWQRFG